MVLFRAMRLAEASAVSLLHSFSTFTGLMSGYQDSA